MKRSIPLVLFAVALLASAPAWAARPFGSFGGRVGGGNAGAGALPLFGWALDDNGIDAVDLFVDGAPAGRASYGRSRPEVTKKHPGFPDSTRPGWAFELDTTRYLNGMHTVSVKAKSRTGEVVSIGSKVFQFNNVTHNLIPFGKIEFPNAQAELRGNCDLEDPARRFSVISGYALDPGVQEDDTGVGYVELMIDRALWANSKTDCFYLAEAGGLSDCYGLRRLDLVSLFPGFKDAPNSGFRFVLDVGFLLNGVGYRPGSHLLTIRVGDVFGQVVKIAEMPVTFTCDEFVDNEESIGEIGTPSNGLIYSGVIQASGWALDWEGVQSVEVFVDGKSVGFATHGLIRPNVTSLYPGYPESAAPGWALSVDTRNFSDGQHTFEVVVHDDLGNDTLIGKLKFVISNP